MPTVEVTEKSAGESAIIEFFGLREQPFGVTPDPQFLYLTASHREALASLVYAIESKRGFSALVAEPGMGKTTLLFHLLDKLKSNARTAFLFRPDSNTRELLQSLLLDLGLEADPQDIPQMHETLKSVLLEDLRAGKHFVWIIDEAQDLEPHVLEAVRLLSNFETPDSKLMHILLAGQPSLTDKLASPELLQLRQRISTMAQLAPLSSRETSDYIRFRVKRAGGRTEDLFSPESQGLIAQASQGIPRNINSLCFSCLSLAFVEGRKKIEPEIVREVLAERDSDNASKEVQAQEEAVPQPRPWPVLPDLNDAPPRKSRFSLGFFVFGVIVIPLLLMVLESNSQFGALEMIRGPLGEEVIQRFTGYNIHVPDLPETLPSVLQPPKPPAGLVESEQRARAQRAADSAAKAEDPEQTLPKAGQKVAGLPNATNQSKGPSRLVFAHAGQTLFDLAYMYYGKSNGVIVAKIQSHNPQIRDSYTRLMENQPVVLPDLVPDFPWRNNSARSGY